MFMSTHYCVKITNKIPRGVIDSLKGTKLKQKIFSFDVTGRSINGRKENGIAIYNEAKGDLLFINVNDIGVKIRRAYTRKTR